MMKGAANQLPSVNPQQSHNSSTQNIQTLIQTPGSHEGFILFTVSIAFLRQMTRYSTMWWSDSVGHTSLNMDRWRFGSGPLVRPIVWKRGGTGQSLTGIKLMHMRFLLIGRWLVKGQRWNNRWITKQLKSCKLWSKRKSRVHVYVGHRGFIGE